MKKAYKIVVTGMVQGIGFRPYVAELAEAYGLAGQVKNLGGIVEIIAFGEEQAMEQLVHRLYLLSGSRVDSVTKNELLLISHEKNKYVFAEEKKDGKQYEVESEHFCIKKSAAERELHRYLPSDVATCERCVAEMHTPSNRRYRYPFISCTACGPRYSIQKAVPYDRESITMAEFEMCDECKAEYLQKGNIRRHAQTIGCKNCGPKLSFFSENHASPITDTEDALHQAVWALQNEKIGAIKDIGGFHFAFSPFSEKAAERLRRFKNRDKKPFAVMFPNMEKLMEYCYVSERERELLESVVRPIVLLDKKKDFPEGICGKSDRIGAFLPCNPLQILLLEQVGPLVMTSGNRGGEPIAISEEEIQPYIESGEIDFMLTHDRKILTPLDDSIYQVVALKEEDGTEHRHVQVIRRARGIVPEPLQLPRALEKKSFAAGGDLKAVFALGQEKLVYLSQHFGDLEEVRCMEARINAVQRMKALFEIEPENTIGDLHPSYISAGGMNHKVQHHHAHAASVIAEHGLKGKVLGIICDGTGYGTDGTIWGSELLLCENADMTRVACFEPVKLLGGDAAAKNADMTLLSYRLQGGWRPEKEGCTMFHLQEQAWKQDINTVYASSMGRLFDAVSAFLDICHYNSYEGECAILLEQAAHRGYKKLLVDNPEQLLWKNAPLELQIVEKDGILQAKSVELILELQRLQAQYSKDELAYFFHRAIAKGMVAMAERICKNQSDAELHQIVLSGGTFVNRILLQEVYEGLTERGKKVYINEKVPCGDGGISFGQMYLETYK